jgi:hypothetical protein
VLFLRALLRNAGNPSFKKDCCGIHADAKIARNDGSSWYCPIFCPKVRNELTGASIGSLSVGGFSTLLLRRVSSDEGTRKRPGEGVSSEVKLIAI